MNIKQIIKELERHKPVVEEKIGVLLSNLAMIAEIPAQTFKEMPRSTTMAERLGIDETTMVHVDSIGNVIGFYSGIQRSNNIVIATHIDSPIGENINHEIEISSTSITGASLADTSLGCAVLTSLAHILKALNIELNHNIVFLGSAQSLGRGSNRGVRKFLEEFSEPIHSAILLEGSPLGRVSYTSTGILRAEISVELPDTYDWSNVHAEGAIDTIIGIVQRIQGIALPSRPKTTIIFGSLEGGHSFDKVPTRATLRLEIRSESADTVQDLKDKIEEIVEEEEAKTRSQITFSEVTHRFPGGLNFGHPLNKVTRELLKSFQIDPKNVPSGSDLSAFIENDIPAILIGLTESTPISDSHQKVELKPLVKGILVLIGLILAIDRGYCDETK